MRASPDFARTASLSLTDKGELMSETENQALTFAKRLKADTTAVHDSVDNLVM
ncbi:TPA: biliverdin-producing heme oxygenase, partial [Neisseria gonorrhoeae]